MARDRRTIRRRVRIRLIRRAYVDGARVTRQAITKHLHALAQAGVVRSQRDGRERIWQVHTKRLHDVSSYLAQISAQWDEALQRLRAAVETET